MAKPGPALLQPLAHAAMPLHLTCKLLASTRMQTTHTHLLSRTFVPQHLAYWPLPLSAWPLQMPEQPRRACQQRPAAHAGTQLLLLQHVVATWMH